MFAATVAYALPHGLTTLVDRVAEASPNRDGGLDRIELHLGASHGNAVRFGERVARLARALAAEAPVLKVRLHLPEPYDNAKPAPPASDVDQSAADERRLIAVLELVFHSPLVRRTFHASDAFKAATAGLTEHVAYATAFAVSGVYSYVRDEQLTLAGLRGGRPAQLIGRIGAVDQAGADVRHLIHAGKPSAGRGLVGRGIDLASGERSASRVVSTRGTSGRR
ncbi:hypothetical protein [Methylobacterium sp. ARG-1]|uniref:hypothetical protein n=1 Tax=Methylobacterium sp. ARG-1 TaxID=1692501 RepID=UPI0007EB01BE|nr:hypothetical protein [Methylobacterium sp. ARG-1]